MSNSISTTASAQPNCFVVMGFGKKTRKEVIAICESWLAANLEPTGSEASEVALKKYLESKYWVLATLAEADVGLGENEKGQQRLDEAYAVPNSRPALPAPCQRFTLLICPAKGKETLQTAQEPA
jgi:hypothetical protein